MYIIDLFGLEHRIAIIFKDEFIICKYKFINMMFINQINNVG